jgi:hypothetical protein
VGNGNSPAPNPTIEVFNPDTLALVRTFQLSTAFTSDIRSIAVDAAGNVYAADWGGTVTKYDPSGAPLKTQTGYSDNLMNIAIDTDGQIAVGGRNGGIYLTDESLNSLRSIQTGQWDVFVTFDHYIGGASQTATPSFSSLAGPTITYGQPTVTLGGKISAGSTYPPGSVNITVAGVSKSAAISSTDGTFSAVFDTSTLGVSGSPYTITYGYAAQGNYAGTTDTSKALTVTPAAATLSSLAGPTISYGQPSVTLGGTISAGALIPTGNVNITVNGVTKSAAINSADGTFSAAFDTSTLAVSGSPYTITYSYAAQGNYAGVTDSSKSLTVTPAVTTLDSLAEPTISYGQPTVTLGGQISAGSLIPTGSVNITLNGVTKSAAISSTDGTFSAAFDTSTLGVSGSPYTITYASPPRATTPASRIPRSP